MKDKILSILLRVSSIFFGLVAAFFVLGFFLIWDPTLIPFIIAPGLLSYFFHRKRKSLLQGMGKLESKENRAITSDLADPVEVGQNNALLEQVMPTAPTISKFIDLGQPYAYIDFETTGLNTHTDQIIEFGAIKIDGGRIVSTFSSLARPTMPLEDISQKALSINQIALDELETAPGLKDTLNKFLSFVDGCVLIGYNISTFDLPMLKANTADILGKNIDFPYIDVIHIARNVLSLQNYRLVTVAQNLGFDTDSAHRAIEDCKLTMECLEVLSSSTYSGKLKIVMPKNYTFSTDNLPCGIDKIHEDFSIIGLNVVITGNFASGSNDDIKSVITAAGGIVKNSISRKVNYLVVGSLGNESWKNGSYGAKIEQAINLRKSGEDIKIVSEKDFLAHLKKSSAPTHNPPTSIDAELNATDGEVSIAEHFIRLIESNCPEKTVKTMRKADNYLTLCLNETDILRFKYTNRARWLSIPVPSGHDESDPLFLAQKNKKQFFWKATIQGFEDLEKFDDLMVEIASNLK